MQQSIEPPQEDSAQAGESVSSAGDESPQVPRAEAHFSLTQWQRDNHIPYARQLPDGRLMGVYRMLLDQGRLFLGGDTTGYDEAWDYPELTRALAAAVFYDGNGDPANGWVRHVRQGHPTRRRPFGEPAREYVEGEDTHG